MMSQQQHNNNIESCFWSLEMGLNALFKYTGDNDVTTAA